MALDSPACDPNLDAKWLQWKKKYGKTYTTTSEEKHRRAVWEKNFHMVEQHNKEYNEGKHSYTMGMNAFADMTNIEFKSKMCTLNE